MPARWGRPGRRGVGRSLRRCRPGDHGDGLLRLHQHPEIPHPAPEPGVLGLDPDPRGGPGQRVELLDRGRGPGAAEQPAHRPPHLQPGCCAAETVGVGAAVGAAVEEHRTRLSGGDPPGGQIGPQEGRRAPTSDAYPSPRSRRRTAERPFPAEPQSLKTPVTRSTSTSSSRPTPRQSAASGTVVAGAPTGSGCEPPFRRLRPPGSARCIRASDGSNRIGSGASGWDVDAAHAANRPSAGGASPWRIRRSWARRRPSSGSSSRRKGSASSSAASSAADRVVTTVDPSARCGPTGSPSIQGEGRAASRTATDAASGRSTLVTMRRSCRRIASTWGATLPRSSSPSSTSARARTSSGSRARASASSATPSLQPARAKARTVAAASAALRSSTTSTY
jgi:hypothetical protein